MQFHFGLTFQQIKTRLFMFNRFTFILPSFTTPSCTFDMSPETVMYKGHWIYFLHIEHHYKNVKMLTCSLLHFFWLLNECASQKVMFL